MRRLINTAYFVGGPDDPKVALAQAGEGHVILPLPVWVEARSEETEFVQNMTLLCTKEEAAKMAVEYMEVLRGIIEECQDGTPGTTIVVPRETVALAAEVAAGCNHIGLAKALDALLAK